MDVYWKKEQIEDALTNAFKYRYEHKDVALTGILLARPEDTLTRDEILPHLNFWHHSFLPDWAKPNARRAIHFTIHQA
jgi:hypothetical protein